MTDGQYVSLAEVRDMLTAENEKRELLPMQKYALAQATDVCHITKEQADELIAKLLDLLNIFLVNFVRDICTVGNLVDIVCDIIRKYSEPF